jgi:hypothetical protein
MPRYVILLHAFPPEHERATHWDLMFEQAGVLRTWALASEPAAGCQGEAEQLADHRPAYLDYEGPVSGERGTVTRWDWGSYRLVEDAGDRLVAELGGRLMARVELVRQAGHLWRVSFSAEPTSG